MNSLKKKPTRPDQCDAQAIAAEIEALAAEIAVCYDQLKPKAKASAVRLGIGLSGLRKRMTNGS